MSDEYDAQDDFAKSLTVGYKAIQERKAKGGPGWDRSLAPIIYSYKRMKADTAFIWCEMWRMRENVTARRR